MWLKLMNGREELVINDDHIKRLKSEGAEEISDPRLLPANEVVADAAIGDVPESEVIADDNTIIDGGSDPADPAQNRRSRQRKSAL